MLAELQTGGAAESAVPSWYSGNGREYREFIDHREDCMKAIHKAGRGERMKVYAALALKFSHLSGFDEQTLGKRYGEWKASGFSLESLRDKRRERGAKSESEFFHAFKYECENNSRSSREAWRTMIDKLRAGQKLLGCGDWFDVWRTENGRDVAMPLHCPYDYTNPPRGASYGNLMQRAGLTAYEKKAARIGPSAARDHVVPVFTTRVGMKPGQWIQFDDVWLDFECKVTPDGAPLRIIEFSAYDVFSGHKIGCQRRPRVRDEETGRSQNASEKEFRCLLAYILTGCGVHKDGVHFMIEHGTATVRPELREKITRAAARFELSVKWEMSGIVGDPVHEGMWRGKGGGNFKLKALTESSHNIVHNLQAALPAQTGHGEKMIEQLAAMKQYDASLVRAMAKLPQEKINLLRTPFPYYHNLISALTLLDDRMADRDWHNLEGWRELGFIVEKFQDAFGHWHDMDRVWAMPEDERRLALAMLSQHPERTRFASLSPRSVWARGAHELVRIDRFLTPELLERNDGFAVRALHNGTMVFTNQFFGPDKVIFHANVTDPSGFKRDLVPGREYWCYATPYLPDELFVCDLADDAILGIAPRYGRAARHDLDAIHSLMGAQAHHKKMLNEPIAARHEDAAAERASLMANNEPLLVEAGVLKKKPAASGQKSEAPDVRANW